MRSHPHTLCCIFMVGLVSEECRVVGDKQRWVRAISQFWSNGTSVDILALWRSRVWVQKMLWDERRTERGMSGPDSTSVVCKIEVQPVQFQFFIRGAERQAGVRISGSSHN